MTPSPTQVIPTLDQPIIPTVEFSEFIDYVPLTYVFGRPGTAIRVGLFLFFWLIIIYLFSGTITNLIQKKPIKIEQYFSVITVYIIGRLTASILGDLSKQFMYETLNQLYEQYNLAFVLFICIGTLIGFGLYFLYLQFFQEIISIYHNHNKEKPPEVKRLPNRLKIFPALIFNSIIIFLFFYLRYIL